MSEGIKKTEAAVREELRRYIDQTAEIRTLSSPQIRFMADADNYRAQLMDNFSRIGELAKDNARILEQYFFPMIDSGDRLDPENLDNVRFFSDSLINATSLSNLDGPLVYYQARRILQEAEKTDNTEARILALDGMVTAAYLMISMASRLMPVCDIVMQYQQIAMDAGEKLLTYLDHDVFLTLSEEMKELIVINARYIRVVSEIDAVPDTSEKKEYNIRLMKDALALAEDPFYREQLPNYNWDLHLFRTYEYICSFTDLNNQKEYDAEQVSFIYESTKKMKDLVESGGFDFKAHHYTRIYELFLIRNAYLAGESSLETYKSELKSLIFRDYREELTDSVPLIMLIAPLEYLLIMDPENLTPEEGSVLTYFYNKLIGYIHQTPKQENLVFLLTCLSLILKHFIEIPGIMDLETMGLSLIAAVHPTTYVHTLSVADFSKLLTRCLIRKQPELFVGMPGYESVEDVQKRPAEIEDYAYHASLCHDFGKLLIADTILTYGRDLLEDEFEFIRSHPAIGAFLLEKHAATAPYADVARGHHKWYNDKGGYPDDFSIAQSPYRTIISIVTCADCLDAATDSIGRSYKAGKSLDEFLLELKEGSGTRYAPYLYDLFMDPRVYQKVEEMLDFGREDNYRKAYYILKKNAGSAT